MNTQIINVGLIGFGMAGRVFHAPTISCVPGLQLKKIRETKPDNIQIIKSKYPNAAIVPTVDDIIMDDAIDLVIIATPNTTHYQLAKKALEAGKHVVVDKPFTVTSAEAEELIQLAKQQNKILTVYHNRRRDSDFKTVRMVLQSGILGNLVECEIHFDRFRNSLRPNTWKEEALPGTGILYDLGSHLIDQAQTLFGLPKSITADLRAQRQQSKIIDHFHIVLDYGALKVTLKAGMLVKEPLPRYILLGNNGSFVKYGLDVQEEALNAGFSPTASNWGEEPESIWGTINTEWNGLDVRGKIKSEKGDYTAYYQNVYKTITGQESLAVQPEEAKNTIRIIELAIKSNNEKYTIAFSNH